MGNTLTLDLFGWGDWCGYALAFSLRSKHFKVLVTIFGKSLETLQTSSKSWKWAQMDPKIARNVCVLVLVGPSGIGNGRLGVGGAGGGPTLNPGLFSTCYLKL